MVKLNNQYFLNANKAAAAEEFANVNLSNKNK